MRSFIAGVAGRRMVLVAALAAGLVILAGPVVADPAAGPTGPKKRIAVARIEVPGKFSQAMGSTDMGGILADQLSTVLAESNDFDVMDRADVTMVLKEQSLTPKSAVQGEAADNPMDLIGAQVIIRASVSTFDQSSGGGLSLGVGSGALTGLLGQKSSRAVIGFDVRLVDTTTGRIIGATRVQETAATSSLSIGLQKGQQSINKDSFVNTPLGKATEAAFRKLEPVIAAKLRSVAWTGRVADVADGEAFLNVGEQNGVKVGDTFRIWRINRRIVDPVSGEFLGTSETQIGVVKATEVNERFCKVQPTTPLDLHRGDVARYSQD